MDNWESLNIEVGLSALQSIRRDLENRLRRCGIMCRVFARCKTMHSLKRKLDMKKDVYSRDGKKLQDMLGLRVVFYFISDIRPFCSALCGSFDCIDISDSEKDFKEAKKVCGECMKLACSDCKKNPDIRFEELFRPERLNLVFRMDERTEKEFRSELVQLPKEVAELIDYTYEVQLRSVLSEGWHEVEHDLRYKCKSDWDGFETESRMLNGIFGSLESHEYAMEMLFDKKAHSHYLRNEWESMLRNHLRLRLTGRLSDGIKEILDKSHEHAKTFLRFEREDLMKALYNMPRRYMVTYDNVVFLMNRLKDDVSEEIKSLEPKLITEILDSVISDNTGQ